MSRQAIFHNGRLHIDETGYLLDKDECEKFTREMLERINGPYAPEMHFDQNEVERWFMADCGVIPTDNIQNWQRGSRQTNNVIIRGEARDTSSKVWLWLIAGVVLAGLLVWWW